MPEQTLLNYLQERFPAYYEQLPANRKEGILEFFEAYYQEGTNIVRREELEEAINEYFAERGFSKNLRSRHKFRFIMPPTEHHGVNLLFLDRAPSSLEDGSFLFKLSFLDLNATP